MIEIKTPHDTYFKASFSDVDVAKDFLITYLPKSILKCVDLSTLELQKDSHVDKKLKEHFSDILYRVDINNNEGYFYLLAEHKSYNDKLSILQLLRYMINIWESKIVKEKQKNLPIIIPMLIYHDKVSWKAHMRLSDWIEGYDDLSDEVKGYIPDYEYILHDLGKYAKENLCKDIRTRLVIEILDKGRYSSLEELKELISKSIQVMMELKLKGESTDLIQSTIKYILSTRNDISTEEMVRIAETVSEDGGEIIMTVAEELIQKGLQAGRLEGELKKAKDTATKAIIKGYDIEDIIDLTGLTRKEIEELIKETLKN